MTPHHRRSRRRTLVGIAICTVIVAALVAGVAATISTNRVRPTASTTYLPFDVPTWSTAGRKVFAHYMPHFPLSFDNKPSDSDYYTTQYLTPTGENGVHAAYGGYLRDRPLPVTPSSAADWKNKNFGTEVDQARSVGINGFAVDVIQARSASKIVDDMLGVASTRFGFSILLTMDMDGPVASQSMADFVDDIATYASNVAATRLDDGRLVLSAFRAENKTPAWWQQVFSLLSQRGISVAFYPILLDANSNLEAFAPISYGLSSWGGRNPAFMPTTNVGRGSPVDLITRAHQLGKQWMQTVAFQDNRPAQGIYDEAVNGTTMRQSWQIATQQNANWVQLITWNDYAEGTQIAPSVKHGYRLLDLMAYYLAQYKSGSTPSILRNAVYVTHRTQAAAQRPSFPQTKLMTLRAGSTPAVDQVEVTAFSQTPGYAGVTINGNQQYCAIPAGVTTCTFPLANGHVSAWIYSNNAVTASADSPVDVTATPYVQDLQYVAGGGLR